MADNLSVNGPWNDFAKPPAKAGPWDDFKPLPKAGAQAPASPPVSPVAPQAETGGIIPAIKGTITGIGTEAYNAAKDTSQLTYGPTEQAVVNAVGPSGAVGQYLGAPLAGFAQGAVAAGAVGANAIFNYLPNIAGRAVAGGIGGAKTAYQGAPAEYEENVEKAQREVVDPYFTMEMGRLGEHSMLSETDRAYEAKYGLDKLKQETAQPKTSVAPTKAKNPFMDLNRQPVEQPEGQPLTIKSAAIENPITGQHFTGESHAAVREMYPSTEGGREGFLTSTGEFVDRNTAAEIARKAKQVPEDFTGELHSEHLKGYPEEGRAGGEEPPASIKNEPIPPAPVEARAPTETPIPESPATIAAQLREFEAGRRPAVFYPSTMPKETIPAPPKGAAVYIDPNKGTFHYDPKSLGVQQLKEDIEADRFGKHLGLGPYNKADVEASVGRGHQPLNVVERLPDGTELRAAASTSEYAPEVQKAFEANKNPESTITVEPMGKVVDERMKAQPVAAVEPSAPAVLTKEPFAAQEPVTVTKRLHAYADDLRQRFGIKTPVIVRLVKRENLQGTGGQVRIVSRTKTGEYVRHIIELEEGLSTTEMATILTHEFGHIIEKELLNKAPEATKKAIMDAWKREMTEKRPRSKEQEVREAYAAGNGEGVISRAKEELKGRTPDYSSMAKYTRKFDEWFANQVSKFLTTDKAATSIVDKFFKGIADQWKALYEKFTGRKSANKEVADFLRKQGKFFDEIAPELRETESTPSLLDVISETKGMTPEDEALKEAFTGEEPKKEKPLFDVYSKIKGEREARAAAEPLRNIGVEGVKAAADTFKAIFAPELREGGRVAEMALRREMGRENQRAEQVRKVFEPMQRMVNAMGDAQKLDLIQWIQQPGKMLAKGKEIPAEIKPVLQALKDTHALYRARLEQLPATQQMNFVDDYLRQMWKDPKKAEQFFGGGKEGSKSFTKGRIYDSYEQGIRKGGLEPVTLDPIEITMRYVEDASKYIVAEEVIGTATERGTVRYFFPGKAPEGWSEVGGRHRTKVQGGKLAYAYAPDGWARVYNNHISRTMQGPWGDALRVAQRVSNTATALKLAISGYHFAMMAQEAIVSAVADATNQIARGNVVGAARSLLEAPAKPITSYRNGKRAMEAYLDLKETSPELRKIIDLGVQANYRFKGKGNIADEYRFSGESNYLKAWKRGSLKAELLSDLHEAKLRPLVGTIKVIAKNLGRAMETISAPLFEHYIPAIKNGAFTDSLGKWLQDNPDATYAEQVAKARDIANMVDERFGEMNQQNIFWSQNQKQAAQLALISFSYELGTIKTLGGGALDVATAPYRAGRALLGKENAKPIWTDRMGYVVALPLVYATMNAITQYLYTGQGPQDEQDLLAARTGGTDVRTQKPERVQWPSYMKDVFGWSRDPVQEAENKISPGLQLVKALATNSDWRGDPISASTDTRMQALQKYLEFVGQGLEPISVAGMSGVSPTSKVGGFERFFGAKPASMEFTDPEGYKNMMKAVRLSKDADAAWHQYTTNEIAAGRPVNYRMKRVIEQQYKRANAQ